MRYHIIRFIPVVMNTNERREYHTYMIRYDSYGVTVIPIIPYLAYPKLLFAAITDRLFGDYGLYYHEHSEHTSIRYLSGYHITYSAELPPGIVASLPHNHS